MTDDLPQSGPDVWLDGYAAGFHDGHDSRDAEVAALHRVADYWYARANNPQLAVDERRALRTLGDGIEENERRARVNARHDAEERALFDRARAMLDEHTDIDIAVKLGLYLPMVENIRAGVL